MFAQDHKGHLFGNWSDAANKDEEKRDFLAGSTGNWQMRPQAGTLWRYIKDENVYRCPTAQLRRRPDDRQLVHQRPFRLQRLPDADRRLGFEREA